MNGHASDNLHTFGIVVGMITSASSLGSTLGPILGGVMTDALDYAWMTTVLSAASLTMVGSSAGLSFCPLNVAVATTKYIHKLCSVN